MPDAIARPDPAAPPLLIGAWRVDPAANELAREGDCVRVEPKVMQVLLQLAQRRGGVVTREQLLDAVWPGVVVGDEALTQTIIKLRRALGDNPRAPVYVETIAKRGYRLIAPVTAPHAAAPAEAHEPPPVAALQPSPLAGPVQPAPAAPAPSVQRPAQRLVWLALAALVVLAGVVAITEPWQAGRSAVVPPAVDGDAGALTVTVVPFETVGAGAEHAYLARGIGNDLMTDLSRLAGLRVVRTASEGGAGSARYVVTGSVQREADALRVNVQLTDRVTQRQLWSERFERPYGDLFAVQDEISRGLVAVLPGKLEEAARRTAAQRYTRNLAAYDHFLRGQSQFLVRQASDNEAARESYRKAIELDPGFARAYAGLAMTYALDPRLRASADPAPALARALELAQTARQIDATIAEVHWALGFIQTQQRQHDRALASLEQAVALNRSYADAYALMAGIHTYVGEPAKSIALMRTALRLDPGGGYLYYMVLGRAYFFQGDNEQALINLREAATRNPVDVETRVFLAATYAAANDRAAAEWEADEVRALEPRFALPDWLKTYPLTDTRQKARLAQLLEPIGL